MAETDNGRINFDNPSGSVISTGDFSGEIEAGDWKNIDGAEGLRYREWKYRNVSEEIVDGSLVEIMPGHRTPVQFVESDHVFEENFQSGKYLVLHVDSEGDFSVYKYDSEVEPASFSLNVNKGEFMCLYTLKENARPGEIVECEQPGFISAKLTTVDLSLSEINGVKIPQELKDTIKKLDQGEEEDLPVEVVDVNEMM